MRDIPADAPSLGGLVANEDGCLVLQVIRVHLLRRNKLSRR